MAKLTLTDISDFRNQTATANTINSNNSAIETALENTLSRDGTSPNQMNSDLDMNSNDITNVNSLDVNTLVVRDTLILDDDSIDIIVLHENTFGSIQIETGSGPFVPEDTTGFLILNRTIAGDSAVNLQEVSHRNGLPLYIIDWAGNAGTITLTPYSGEKIMGLTSASIISFAQGLGTGGKVLLIPVTTLSGWVQGS